MYEARGQRPVTGEHADSTFPELALETPRLRLIPSDLETDAA